MNLQIKVARIDATMSVDGVTVAEYHSDGGQVEITTFGAGDKVWFTPKGRLVDFEATVLRVNRKSITVRMVNGRQVIDQYAQPTQLKHREVSK